MKEYGVKLSLLSIDRRKGYNNGRLYGKGRVIMYTDIESHCSV